MTVYILTHFDIAILTSLEVYHNDEIHMTLTSALQHFKFTNHYNQAVLNTMI